MFFSFDGIDGVGKTTQMQLFCQWLTDEWLTDECQRGGREIVTCRDPGSTPLGERVREILLNSDDSTPITARSEMLLYMAARAQLVEQVICPALAAGKIVVSDRYLLANVVYQGYAGGLDVVDVRDVGRVATGGLMPDCTFLLDMSPTDARSRMGEQLDRVESRGDEYREQLRQGFLQEAQHTGDRVHVVAADRAIDDVQSELREIAKSLLPE
jgi:dTMP kinase